MPRKKKEDSAVEPSIAVVADEKLPDELNEEWIMRHYEEMENERVTSSGKFCIRQARRIMRKLIDDRTKLTVSEQDKLEQQARSWVQASFKADAGEEMKKLERIEKMQEQKTKSSATFAKLDKSGAKW